MSLKSKGTKESIKSLSACPPRWKAQVQNVNLFLSGKPFKASRYLVVGTRINPNAKKPKTRALQVRAWNQKQDPLTFVDSSVAAEIASAHLFGLFKNLGLWENARALAYAPWRREHIDFERWRRPDDNVIERAADEIKSGRANSDSSVQERSFAIGSEFGPVQVELSRPLLDLVATLRVARDSRAAANALFKADKEIDTWTKSMRNSEEHWRVRTLPYGARMVFPERFEIRGDE